MDLVDEVDFLNLERGKEETGQNPQGSGDFYAFMGCGKKGIGWPNRFKYLRDNVL